jgi:hypothetical protein
MTSNPSHRAAGHAPGADATLDALTLRSPEALICAVPYLLGFRPRESAVLVWLGRGRILLTQRLDLPVVHVDLAPWQRAVWSHRAAVEADELIAVLFCGPHRPLIGETVSMLTTSAGHRGLVVRDLLRSEAGRWSSLLCTDPDCCPEGGREMDPVLADRVAAEFALLGRAPLPDRESVVASLDPDPAQVAAVEASLADARRGMASAVRESPDRWRDAAVTHWEEWLAATAREPRCHDPADTAVLLVSLADIRVRDTLLWDLVQVEGDRLPRLLDRVVDLVRAAPRSTVGPVATCAAVIAWLSGDGARAAIAVDRALAEDPDYSLATLVGASLRAGLPPTVWREAMRELSRADCRFGPRGGLGG